MVKRRNWFSRLTFNWSGIAQILLILLPAASAARVHASENIDIALNQAALKNPLLELELPPTGSRDRVGFMPSGILIKQLPAEEGGTTGGAGLKLLVSSQGDFCFEVDFECRKLDKPTSGWGQGLMIRCLTDDPNSSVLAFGCIATMKQHRTYYIQFPHNDGTPPDRYIEPSKFASGTWIIERKGSEISLMTKDSKSQKILIKTMPCTSENLNGIQLWCTRQKNGNTSAEFLLKHIRFQTDSFFVFEESRGKWNIGGFITMLGCLGLVTSGAFLWWQKRST